MGRRRRKQAKKDVHQDQGPKPEAEKELGQAAEEERTWEDYSEEEEPKEKVKEGYDIAD